MAKKPRKATRKTDDRGGRKQYLVKVWYFVDTDLSPADLRSTVMARWAPMLGDALENVEIDDLGGNGFKVVSNK